MILRKATIAYLLIMSSLTLIPVSVVLTSPTSAHAMTPFATYQDIQEYIHANSCTNPAPLSYSRGGLPGPTTANSDAQSNSGSSQSPNHSETNQQVSGVDEFDTVKNDGQYVYTVTNNTVAIVQAYPATDARLVAKINSTGTVQGIFVVGNKLVVVSALSSYPYSYYSGVAKPPTIGTGVAQPTGIATIVGIPFSGITSLFVYDMTDHANPVIATRVDLNGTLAGARLIGNDVYVVTTESIYCGPRLMLPEQIVNGEPVAFGPAQFYHSDVSDQGYSFTTVLGFDASQTSPSPAAKIFLIGTTSTIYVSLHDIFLTQPVWAQSPETVIHRISIDGLSINYQATGEVPGHVLNQFSMDEYNDYFRIATTNCCGQIIPLLLTSSPSVSQQDTNVYVLDHKLSTVGKLEGLSPGEQMYSARFMQDKAYLVTYKRMDPLIVIGLQDPTKPTVLGQLNVTGVSDYLQPFDETHLIGIGQAGTDVAWENAVRFTGLKISLFNVTDPSRPTDTSNYEMGGPGSSSPATTDHKAVLFDKPLNLLVIPVELTPTQPQNSTGWYYSPPVWQGAYVFNITPDNGIVLRGAVTQLPNGQAPLWLNSGFFVTRALYIGSVLYTISNNKIQMNNLADLSPIGSISLA